MNLALELLKRTGQVKKVKIFLETIEVEDPLFEIREANFYGMMAHIRKCSDCGFDYEARAKLENPAYEMLEYLKDPRVQIGPIEKFLDILIEASHVEMEVYAQIGSYYILDLPELSNIFRRFMGDESFREKMEEFIKRGFSILFIHHNFYPEIDIEEAFKALIKWKDLVNFEKEFFGPCLVSLVRANDDFTEEGSNDCEKDYTFKILDKLSEVVSKEKIARAAKELFQKSETSRKNYKFLVKEGKIDSFKGETEVEEKTSEVESGKEEEGARKELRLALNEFSRWPNSRGVRDLAKELKDNELDIISKSMPWWLKCGNLKAMYEILTFEDKKLHNETLSKELISSCLKEAIEEKNFDLLSSALKLPEVLVDIENPELKEFTSIWKMFH